MFWQSNSSSCKANTFIYLIYLFSPWPFKKAVLLRPLSDPVAQQQETVGVYNVLEATRSFVRDRVTSTAPLIVPGQPPSDPPFILPPFLLSQAVGTMAQTDVLLTKEPAPQSIQACELPHKEYDVACNTGAYTSSGLATAGFRTAKYLMDEWFQNCYARYHQAFADRDNSERQRHESRQLAAETEALAQRTQQDSTRKVGERLEDMHCWKSELQREIDELSAETELMRAQKRRLERALDATALPFSIATDNLQCRERRQHPDLVRDYVEVELLKVQLRPRVGGRLWHSYRVDIAGPQGSHSAMPSAHAGPPGPSDRRIFYHMESLTSK